MARTWMALAALAAFSLAASPAGAKEHGRTSNHYDYGYRNGDKDRFGWAIVSGDNTSSSELYGDELDKLKSTVGDEFLYLRDGEDGYVITDRGLVRRAKDALKPIQDAGREIGAAVGKKVEYSLNRSSDSRERARLERRIERLKARIERLQERDEDTSDLEARVRGYQGELAKMKSERSERDDREAREAREAELDQAQDRASKHMREATERLDRELHDILREAKERHLAEKAFQD